MFLYNKNVCLQFKNVAEWSTKGNVWIGGRKLGYSWRWVGPIGEHILFGDWMHGEPNARSTSSTHCLSTEGWPYLTWLDSPCDYVQHYVCERVANYYF